MSSWIWRAFNSSCWQYGLLALSAYETFDCQVLPICAVVILGRKLRSDERSAWLAVGLLRSLLHLRVFQQQIQVRYKVECLRNNSVQWRGKGAEGGTFWGRHFFDWKLIFERILKVVTSLFISLWHFSQFVKVSVATLYRHVHFFKLLQLFGYNGVIIFVIKDYNFRVLIRFEQYVRTDDA